VSSITLRDWYLVKRQLLAVLCHEKYGGNMISRHWRGLAKPLHADDYVQHLRSETFPALSKIPGFISASILRRNVQRGVEFLS